MYRYAEVNSKREAINALRSLGCMSEENLKKVLDDLSTAKQKGHFISVHTPYSRYNSFVTLFWSDKAAMDAAFQANGFTKIEMTPLRVVNK